MKKITLLFLLVFSFIATFSQTTYPVTQNLGSPQTLVLSKGGLKADSSLILPSFPDTTSANTSLYIKNYPGNMIRVGNNVYVRNSTATAWIGVGGGSVSISQGYGITNTPNPITTTGTIKVDTSFSTGLSGKYFRLSDTARYLKIDNLSASYPMFTDLFVDGVGISIFAVDNNNDGYLTIADYKKFTNKVDTIYRTPGKDSIIFNINGRRRAIKDSSGGGGTVTRAVDTIYRTLGKDSIIFTINGIRRAIKDSTGGGGGYFTKNIIMNGTSSNRLGNYVNGDTIPVAGLGLDSAFKIITQKAVAPTYVSPTASISSSPTASYYEIGTNLGTITLSSTFTQNDAGSLTGTTYYKNNTTPLGSNTDVVSSLTSTIQYKVTKSYNQGACKANNLGDIDCTGRINAGSVSSSNISFAPAPYKYWGYTSSGTPNSSQIITTSGGGFEFAFSKEKYSFSIVVTGTNQYVYYAYPTYLGALSSIIISGLESIGAFNLTTVNVTNAQGYTQSYYVYTSQNQFNNTTISFNSAN